MKDVAIDILLDEAAEIMLPHRCNKINRLAVCACCGQAGQPMDDDGCGICDACLEMPVQATDLDGLDIPATFPYLSLTARHR